MRLYPPFGYSILYKEYYLTGFNPVPKKHYSRVVGRARLDFTKAFPTCAKKSGLRTLGSIWLNASNFLTVRIPIRTIESLALNSSMGSGRKF